MSGEIELWAPKRFGRVPIRVDWFGSVKRSSRSGTVQPLARAKKVRATCNDAAVGTTPLRPLHLQSARFTSLLAVE